MATTGPDYDFRRIEPTWQGYWDDQHTFQASAPSSQQKFYILDMFPYPSGAGLHLGHCENYTITDVMARYQRARGRNVLYPIGWDAFGLPTENYAVKTGRHPAEVTLENVATFRRQLKAIGVSYDFTREVDTTDPKYFRWTQWIFLQLFRRNLAYVQDKPVWWCPALGTVLANEEVIDGKSEVGGHPVERRPVRQWVLRITEYADRLLAGLKDLDWPDSTKRMQAAWIGRSEGSEVDFDIADLPGGRLKIFTTRVDTIFGATYMVIAPEHALVPRLTTATHQSAVAAYIKTAASKSDLERTDLAKDKSGVFTGSYAINPANGARMPIWIADYVLVSYGTGAIMAVPAHDERDYEFAQKFDLPIPQVIAPADGSAVTLPFIDKGGDVRLINSGDFSGLTPSAAKEQLDAKFLSASRGKGTVQFKLRDWLFSRQRYWGEPFPIVWVTEADYRAAPKDLPLPPQPVTCMIEGTLRYALPVPEGALPLQLPQVKTYQPTGTGESPLAAIPDWIEIWYHPATGESVPASAPRPTDAAWIRARRESNTMPQWAGSCWYYLRFLDPHNNTAIASPELLKYWGVPDLYVGGAEHAVLHLLYARFWHKVLFDIGAVPVDEPFKKLFHQGIILGELEYHLILNEDGTPRSATLEDSRALENRVKRKVSESEVEKRGNEWFWKENPTIRVDAQAFKMSKSRGNVANPEQVIHDYGADTLRLYLMFLGPLEAKKPWSMKNIEGVSRFLRGVWREVIGEDGQLNAKLVDGAEQNAETDRLLHATIKKVTEDIEGLRYNTAIPQLMVLRTQMQKAEKVARTTLRTFLQLLHPLAPHIASELWDRLGEKEPLHLAAWPVADASKLVSDTVKLVIQINGKMRADLMVAPQAPEADVLALAQAIERVALHTAGKTIRKVIYVPGRILNLVVG